MEVLRGFMGSPGMVLEGPGSSWMPLGGSLEVLRGFMGSQSSKFSHFCNPYGVICTFSKAQHGPGCRDVNGLGRPLREVKRELGGPKNT